MAILMILHMQQQLNPLILRLQKQILLAEHEKNNRFHNFNYRMHDL
ncbi:hypothetical protein Cpin_3598 [Chitinophaga pinensis DSM 2588]|uniref:Uncharacterized protein n=1 Tax=Chitinophaga pinensis (strain ATCC 43595 / DSM 2588 / LMG 13176 / NBRC 15968 / NCIMB 11800 / UQM 2034) TaxID=485918 RepID=A0A979G5D9_CHIPD|nr:hypothetical protein Cpin_3598 [Chitinophaga pinensis DSM 2588]